MSRPCAALPSGQAAHDLVNGDPDALGRVVLYTFGRAALLAAGMYAGGKRSNVVRDAMAGALGIEAFVLAWAAWRSRD